ncbi:MAG: tetratricopeptide repeat protein [Bacteroidota bacterium]
MSTLSGQSDIDRELATIIDTYQATHNTLTRSSTTDSEKSSAFDALIALFESDKVRIYNHFFSGGRRIGIFNYATLLSSKVDTRGLQIRIKPIRQYEEDRNTIVECTIGYEGISDIETDLYLEFFLINTGDNYKIINIYRNDAINLPSTTDNIASSHSELSNAIAYLEERNCEAARGIILNAAKSDDKKAQYHAGKLYEIGCGVPKDTEKAISWFKKSAEQEYLPANFHLALLYLEGNKTAKDEQTAFYWCERAARKGYTKAEFLLGWLHEKGMSTHEDESRAELWYDKAADKEYTKAVACYDFQFIACEENENKTIPSSSSTLVKVIQTDRVKTDLDSISRILILDDPKFNRILQGNSSSAKYNAGMKYLTGVSIDGKPFEKDTTKAIKLFHNASINAHSDSQYRLAVLLRNLGDYAQSMKWYRQAAEQGHIDAKFDLGYIYYGGNVVEKNMEQAFYWFQQIEKLQNNPSLLLILGGMYYDGVGSVLDKKNGLDFLIKATNMGSFEAAFKVGEIYWKDMSNVKKALKYYKIAATNGYLKSAFVLGQLYTNGDESRGFVSDIKTAIYWYNLAVAQGHAESSYRLGIIYESIELGKEYVDKDEAKRRFIFACDKDFEKACQKLSNLD